MDTLLNLSGPQTPYQKARRVIGVCFEGPWRGFRGRVLIWGPAPGPGCRIADHLPPPSADRRPQEKSAYHLGHNRICPPFSATHTPEHTHIHTHMHTFAHCVSTHAHTCLYTHMLMPLYRICPAPKFSAGFSQPSFPWVKQQPGLLSPVPVLCSQNVKGQLDLRGPEEEQRRRDAWSWEPHHVLTREPSSSQVPVPERT